MPLLILLIIFQVNQKVYETEIMNPNDQLHLKIKLSSSPEKIYELLSTNHGREKFWVEKSVESNKIVTFYFPNGAIENCRILKKVEEKYFKIEYFNSLVEFKIIRHSEKECILELNNFNIPAADRFEQYAGWVSVLLSLKAYADFGIDLRNHHPDYTWDQHFIDN